MKSEESDTLELERDNLSADDYNFDAIDDDLEDLAEDEMVQQALQRGVDLKKYGRELEKELKNAENESVMQYCENNSQVVDLHKQMQECDAVLARMQDMLWGFQEDLGGISEEIKHLQDESLSMSIRLKNRKQAEEILHDFIDNSTIPIEYAEKIVAPEVNEEFLKAVLSLNDKLKYLKTPNQTVKSSKIPVAETYTAKSLLPELEKLKLRALQKIRDYFAAQFKALRKPKTNVQVAQQNSLVKYAKLLQFLQVEAPHVGDELRNLYVESMGRTILSLFKSYSSQLLKLDLIVATKHDLIAVEEAMLKSLFTQKVNLTKRMDSFSLGDRDRLLDQIEAEPILLHVAIAENQKYPFEAILRSIIKHLSDAATNEFLFLVDFFKTNTRDTFNRIFGRTLSLILEYLENYLINCFDAISLLLMVKITHLQRMVMQRRRVPVLDSFFDRISLLLWPRLKAVLEGHLKSIKNANARKLGTIDLTPHYISRRYAELVVSILTLQANGADTAVAGSMAGVGGGGDSMLQHDLQQLRTEMASLLERVSMALPSPKDRTVFLINNYDQILSVFQERRIVCEESSKFEEFLLHQRELFAEEEIRASFPKLISFVLQTEQSLAAATNTERATVSAPAMIDELLVETLVREFAASWRTGIQQINDNVLANFANFKNGMEILKQVLTQLLLYYTRFQDIIKKSFPKPPAFSRDIVSTATILMEIKRYSRSF